MRVNTIRHKAWPSWRSPPGLSRWRVTFPDDAGIGAAPHRCAQAASLCSRPGWSPAAMSSSAAVRGPTPVQGGQAGGAGGDQRDDELVQAGELAGWELGAAPQLAQRDAGGVADGTAGPGRSDASPVIR